MPEQVDRMANIERCAICHEEHDRAVHCLVPVVERLRDELEDMRADWQGMKRAADQSRGAVEAARVARELLTFALDAPNDSKRKQLVKQAAARLAAFGGQ